MNIAVIGGGISGICAAYILSKEHQVTLFEKNDYVGGHTNTRIVDGTPVDTGFIVCNPRNYPNFYKFLANLGVSLQDSEMSFGFYRSDTGLAYCGPALRDFLRTPENFLKPDFLRMVFDQRRFGALALKGLKSGRLTEEPLADYIKEFGFSRSFIENYLNPLISAIWSTPGPIASNISARTFIEFFNNHGMLKLSDRPQWQTVVGGSFAYVKAFLSKFLGKVFSGNPVAQVERSANSVVLTLTSSDRLIFDRVVIGTHADEALRLLTKPSESEARLLGKWRYNQNLTTLHSDESIMPVKRRLWASWNYLRKTDGSTSALYMTYYMNRLQALKSQIDYFVSLNSADIINPGKVHYETLYTHPIYSPESVGTQAGIRALNGQNNTFFCGAYLGYGFHEDGVNSALEVAKHFGLGL